MLLLCDQTSEKVQLLMQVNWLIACVAYLWHIRSGRNFGGEGASYVFFVYIPICHIVQSYYIGIMKVWGSLLQNLSHKPAKYLAGQYWLGKAKPKNAGSPHELVMENL